jgi:hypothetical protein
LTEEAQMAKKRWSQGVMERSDALDLDPGVFTRTDPRSIARSLKRSAERSRRRKSDPYRSAMSMLSFYINRAGRTLPAARRRRLDAAKNELRKLYGRAPRTWNAGARKTRKTRKATATTTPKKKRTSKAAKR